MTQLRSARHSRYPSYFAPSGCPCRREGGKIIEQLYQLLGNLWPTKWLKLGPIMGHSAAHSWAYLGPLRGSLLAIGRKVGRYSPARDRRRTHGGADTGRSETDAASQHIIPPSHMTSLIISSSYRRLCAVCALGVQSKCTRFQAKNTHKWQEFSLCALCAVFSYKTYI